MLEKLPKFNAQSLKNICLRFITDNLSKFNIDILPLELQEKLQGVNLSPRQYSPDQTLDPLNDKLNQLTRESWKCFGLKLTVPLIPLLLTSLAVISLRTKNKKEKEPNVKALYCMTGSGVLSFFGGVFCYSKEKHEQQKEIDKAIELTKQQIATKKRYF